MESGGKKLALEIAGAVLAYIIITKLIRKHVEPNSKMKIIYHFNTRYTGNLDSDIVSFILEKEGGVSNDKADKASLSPLKFDANIGGKLMTGIHTNKGITVDTFFHYAPLLKIPATQSQFLSMPNNSVGKIFKEIYYKPFTNSSSVPLFNYTFGIWAWGSGVGTAKALLNSFCKAYGVKSIDEAVTKYGKQTVFENLVEHRIDFYNELGIKNPANYGKFVNGWVNAASNFYEIFKPYAA